MPGYGIQLTRVLAPADPAWGLVGRAAFKGELGLSGTAEDPFIAALIAAATAAIERHCNRRFAPETVADTIVPAAEPYPWQVPARPGPIGLSRFPLIGPPAATAPAIIADGAVLVDGIDVLVDGALGLVHRLGAGGRPAAWTAASVTATYTAGLAAPPADLADAATRLMKARWFGRARDPGVRSETVPEVIARAFWFGSGPGGEGALPPDVAGLLAPWRLPAAA